MLTIKNYKRIKTQTFHFHGVEWTVYEIEEQQSRYVIVFMPKDHKNRVWDISKSQFVYLDRDRLNMVDSYSIRSGTTTSFVTKEDLKDMQKFMKVICMEGLLPHIVYNYQNVPF